MKLLFATGNEKKYELMKERLKSLKTIEVVIPKQLGIKIEVEENGKTPRENAQIKAKAYFKQTKMPVIAEDSGLWIKKFSKENQPGLLVKRVKGKENLSNEEILKYYIEELQKVGGESQAFYKTGIVLINEKGEIFGKTIKEEPFILTTKVNKKSFLSGGILDLISYDPISQKYFNELKEEEKQLRYRKIDEAIRKMAKEALFHQVS